LEVVEVLEVLRGEGPHDLRELCLELSAWMFQLGGATHTIAEGKALAGELIRSGKALDKFREMVKLQGGDVHALDHPEKLPHAKHTLEVLNTKSGFVTAIECEAIGTACVVLGGGREKKEDSVDPGVGIVLHRKVGDPISAGESLCTVHYNSNGLGARAKDILLRSYHIADVPPAKHRALVHRVIRGSGGK
jgi:thymidine phosphorylase